MKKYKRIVIKIGTKVITSKDKLLDKERIKDIVEQVAELCSGGAKVIIVTSGAIGAGMGLAGMKKRPSNVSDLQAAAAIGQSHLMHIYNDYFRLKGKLTGQILLTQEDFNDRARYLNIKNTINSLLKSGVIPVINENDSVATDEIRCGDNDRLSGLVSDACEADLLVLLTDVDGLMDRNGRVIAFVDEIDKNISKLAGKAECELGTGGMATKLEAAKHARNAGIDCVIANGKKKDILLKIARGEGIGTAFKKEGAKLIAKKRWIAFSSAAKGAIMADDGARSAVSQKNKSLLASGITGVSGHFKKGDVIKVTSKNGEEFARGVTNYSSSDLVKIKGLNTNSFKSALGYKGPDEIIHKDNLVIL